jgi:hypothetical protein
MTVVKAMLTVLVITCIGAKTGSGSSQEAITLKRKAEDQVAKQFDAIRASAKLPELARITPTIEQVQLVCSAAISGKEVREPMFGGLTTYVTADPTISDERLRNVAVSLYGQQLKHGTRYSIAVLLDRSSTADHPMYMVGVL